MIRPSLAQLLTPSPTPVQREPRMELTRSSSAIVQRQSDDEEEEETNEEEEEEEFGRTPTAYSYLGKNAIAKVKPTTQVSDKPQGPHFFSDVGTNEFFDQANEKNLALTRLLHTRIIPTPGQAITQVSDAFNSDVNKKYRIKGRAETSYQRRRYSDDYKGLYRKAQTGDEASIRRLVNLAPQQTLAWSGKKATSTELAGKGETREKAQADFEKSQVLEKKWQGEGGHALTDSNYQSYLDEFETVDNSTLRGRGSYKGLQHAKRHRSFNRFLEGEELSEASEAEGSWSDSEPEEEEKVNVGGKRKTLPKKKDVLAKRTKATRDNSSEDEVSSEDDEDKKKTVKKKVKGKGK